MTFARTCLPLLVLFLSFGIEAQPAPPPIPLPAERFILESTNFLSVGPAANQVDVLPTAIVVGPGDELYVRDTTSIKVFTSTGTFVRSWACAARFSDAITLYGPIVLFQGGVVAQCGTSGALQRFSTTGSAQATLAPFGTAAGQVHFVSEFALLPDGRLAVADARRGKVLIFSATGTFVTEWGSFQPIMDVGVPQPEVVLRLAATGTNRIITYFGSGGSVTLETWTADGESSPTPAPTQPCSPTSIRLLGTRVYINCFNDLTGSGQNFPAIVITDLEMASTVGLLRSNGPNIAALIPFRANDLAMLSNGDLLGSGPHTGSRGLRRYARVHRTPRPSGATRIPVVEINPPVSRPGTTLVDVDFQVRDSDSATVTTAAIVFRGLDEAPVNAVRMQTLVEGTATSIGAGTPTNVVRRLTWNALADLGVGSGLEDVTVHVIAHDGAGLLDLEFLTLPAGVPSPGDPQLEISRTRVVPRDLSEIWIWLLARGDAGVVLVGGALEGTGADAGVVYVQSNGLITPAGRLYLLGRLGLRIATFAEITRARIGTTPGEQTFAPLYTINISPVQPNEIGFDLGGDDGMDIESFRGFYVVPVP